MDQKNYVNQIKENYVPRGRTRLDELKELDGKVKLPPMIISISIGIIAALVLGVGMCLAMKVIGANVLSDTAIMALGVVIGCAGIALCIANYFIYKVILASRKRKYGAQILAISDELLNNGD
ncbi:MAG: dihydropteridine reductase [Clostridia bacterium]|nr:dihydropteridine reductase [Clostridia bacterium]